MASDLDPLVRYKPAPDERPIEAIIGKNIAKRSLFVAPVLALIFGLLQGWPGVVAALVGVTIVVANFLLGGYIMASAARVSLNLYHAAALFGLRSKRLVPSKFGMAIEALVVFVRDEIAVSIIGPEGVKYYPWLLALFMFILVGNLFEVTPLINFPITSRM